MIKSNNKNELRRNCRLIRDGFGEEFIKEASAAACERLAQSPEFESADTVLLYYPIKNEISPLPLFELALSKGKSVAFPICRDTDMSLTFKRVSALNQLKPARLGLLEPDGCAADRLIMSERTLCIVPALLFSRSGHRLGYGKGYYDRFLKNFQGISAGLSYSALVCDSLPHEEHDVPLDMIITEREVLYLA